MLKKVHHYVDKSVLLYRQKCTKCTGILTNAYQYIDNFDVMSTIFLQFVNIADCPTISTLSTYWDMDIVTWPQLCFSQRRIQLFKDIFEDWHSHIFAFIMMRHFLFMLGFLIFLHIVSFVFSYHIPRSSFMLG